LSRHSHHGSMNLVRRVRGIWSLSGLQLDALVLQDSDTDSYRFAL